MLNYEIIDASKALTLARSLKKYSPPFKILEGYRLIDDGVHPEATVQIESQGKEIHEAATGNGPVDALATVLKKALIPLFAVVETIKLIDYRANIIGAHKGTETEVEVTIIFTDGNEIWKVYHLAENINNASFRALVDGFEYAILKENKK